MYTMIIAVLVGVLSGAGLIYSESSSFGWGLFWGALIMAATQLGTGWIVRRKVQEGMEQVQSILQHGQQRLQQKMAKWQIRPPGSVKQAQNELEREQNAFIDKALDASKSLEKFRRWSPFFHRQLATLRMQLYYQQQRYDEVDRLMPACLLVDPMSMSMKLARMHVRGESVEKMEAFFRRSVRRVRYGQGALLYALFSWILVKRERLDEAHKVLIKGCERMDNELLKRNRDHLANNRLKSFSNAGFGDEWYALGLEKPKVRARRQKAPPGRYF